MNSIKPVDQFPIEPPSRRRLLWEAFGDVQRANTWLFIIVSIQAMALTSLGFVVLSIYRRPPYVLTTNRGYVQYESTEGFKLHPEMIVSYLTLVMGRLFDVTPGAYDLTPAVHFISPDIYKIFNGLDHSKAAEATRVEKDIRRIFSLYEVRSWSDPKYPQYLAYIIRGEETTYQRKTDALGNTSFYPEPQIVFYKVWLKQKAPTPENPWGLMLYGITNKLPHDVAEQDWPQAKPIINEE